MTLQPEARPDDQVEDQSQAFARLLNTEISDDNPDAFGENVDVVLSLARDHRGEQRFSPGELKVLVRHLSRRFEARSGNQIFSRGVYQTFFSGVHAESPSGRRELDHQIGLLAQISDLLENETLAVRTLRAVLIQLWSELTTHLPDDDEDNPHCRLLTWRMFELLVRGVLHLRTFSTAERTFHYAAVASPAEYRARLGEERRRILLEDFRFSFGDAYPRRPLLRHLVARSTALTPADRELLMQAITAQHVGDADPFSHLLRHHAFLLACGDGDMVTPYFRLVDALLEHLLTRVFAAARDETSRVMLVYLTLIREQHLRRLRGWCDAMRASRGATPLLADLLQEPYLLRTGTLDGTQEPSLSGLLHDWGAVQAVAERQEGYDGPDFSVTRYAVEEGRDWIRRRGRTPTHSELDVSGFEEPMPTARGMPVRELDSYETFVQIPVISEESDGLETVPSALEEDDVDSEAFTLPRIESNLFDVMTQRLPTVSAELMDLSGARTLILPSSLGGGTLHRASTIILPATAPGEADEGLHQSTTLIFPVQSVPVSRNEAICRRVDVLLKSQREHISHSTERLRLELEAMPDEDRIIAEQYLAQVIEREMGRLARRLHQVGHMSMVTLDDYAGTQLSAVLREFVVTGYLRRVFLAECAGLYAEFAQEEVVDASVLESLQLALYTVLNAHQDRLQFPPALERALRRISKWPAEEPLTSRLPYHFPTAIQYPRDLSARVARTGSWQLVFEAEYLLEGQVHELERTVTKVAQLEIFTDLETALGSTGFNEQTYLAFCGELHGRLQLIVDRARGLFVRLEEVGQSSELEQFLLQLIGYGRTVWNRSVFPALAFYAKMAFGTRE